jgi:large subunit ribosomal protein L5e
VPRITNTKVICQIIYATLKGDKCLVSANSDELKKFGITCGLANYSACYATGLLCARRLLSKIGLDKQYSGAETNGEYYSVGDNYTEGKQPFKAVLDIGLVATTTGNRVFGALKGAVDGGLNIPHNTKRFPGTTKGADKEEVYEAAKHRERIFGVHVDKYMKELKAESKEDFEKQFSLWSKCLTAAKAKSVEELYKKAHEGIRKSPALAKKAASKNPDRKHSKFAPKRQNAAQRKVRVEQKMKIALAKKSK